MNNTDDLSAIRIARAFAKAKAMLGDLFMAADLNAVICAPVDDAAFMAEASAAKDGYIIAISAGVVAALDDAWMKIANLPSMTFIKAETAKQNSDKSLIWLCLHELIHVALGHLSYMPQARLIEVGIAARPTQPPTIMLSDDGRKDLAKCLELQADSDASDVFLGLYDPECLEDLRSNARAAFVVMALIEKLNQQNDTHSVSHPMAATRFFMLMAHLFQMWSYRGAHLEVTDDGTKVRTPKLLETTEFEHYARVVLAPLVDDAVDIAAAIGADRFVTDMGGAGALFHDIHTIQFASPLLEGDLQSDAAKEWLSLGHIPINGIPYATCM